MIESAEYADKPNQHRQNAGESENVMKNNVVWYHRPEEAAADCIAWEDYKAPAEIEEEPEEEAPKPEALPAGCIAIETRHAGTPYTAAQTEPETEPEPEKSETRTSKTAEIVAYTADIAEIVEKYKRNGWKNPEFTRIAPNQYKLNGECPLVVNRQGDRLYYDIQAAPVKASNWFEKIKIVKVGA